VKTETLDLQLPSGRLHALQTGSERGAPVLCVPGLSANARSFDAIAGSLAGSGHHVVALDLRGRGLSPAGAPGTLGWRRHAEDVLQAASHLGFKSFDLVGHSMGAFVSMQAAALEAVRIRRLVLIDAAGVPEPAVLPPILAAVQRLNIVYRTEKDYCALIQRHGAAQPWDALWKEHYLYDLERVRGGVQPRTSKTAVLEDVVYGSRQDAKSFWPSLKMPTLLVRAARPLLPGTGFVVGTKLRDAFLAAVPSAEAVEIDANHYGVMAHPEALRAITRFLTC
jgi:pimeloyl-ACP methyl ester carboxylesterase